MDGENLDLVETNLRSVFNKEAGISDKIIKEGNLNRANLYAAHYIRGDHRSIPIYKVEKEIKLEEVEMADKKLERALDIGIIGVGGAGNHIAEAFAKAGYDSMVINLTNKDYDHLKYVPNDDDSRLQLIVGAGGAGKNPEVGAEAVKEYSNYLVKKIQRKFNNKEFIYVAAGLGGGTGTLGGRYVAEIAASLNIPVGMIITLPRKNEGTDEKINCLKGLQEVANYKGIKSIVVIDNDKVVARLNTTKDNDFWTMANNEIVSLFDSFNVWSATPSNTAFDAEDYKKVLMTPGFLVLGSSVIDNAKVDSASSEDELKKAVQDIDKGFLATGFDKSTAVRAAGLIIKSNDLDYSHSFEETLFNHIKTEIGAGGLNRGIYLNENQNGYVQVKTILAGMKLPQARVQELVVEAKAEATQMSNKIKERESETIDLGLGSDFDIVSETRSTTSGTPGQGLGRRK